MCGITGFWSRDESGDARTILQGMTSAIAHRGPDDTGIWFDDRSTVALGHRRLSIIDLSAEGHQPMTSANGRYVIVFNGEIYNYQELRAPLLERGARFRGHSDTEVLLAAIVAWGLEETLKRAVGMFAFALWDRDSRTMALVRDRFGEKPLYFAQFGGTLLFGSELKAMRAHPAWRGDIDRDALALFFRHNYVPAPYTIYANVRKVIPGTIVRVAMQPNGAARETPYWSIAAVAQAGVADPLTGSDDELLDAVDQALRRSVRGQMISDVPLGAFLSGGIDSSAVVAAMQAESSRPVRTFTVGFAETGFDEAPHARAIAKHLGTDHTEAYVTAAEARDVIPRLPSIYDEPFADSSQIPTFLVARVARRHVTVSLSGDGGDEMFGGYTRYAQLEAQWNRLGRVPLTLRRGLAMGGRLAARTWAAVAPVIAPLVRNGRRPPSSERIRQIALMVGSQRPEILYRRMVSYWSDSSGLVPRGHELPTLLADAERWPTFDELTARAMLLDMLTYLPDDILVKVDRASMAVSLESRAPMLDHRLAELAWRLPRRMRVRDGQQKWALRQVLYRYVPAEMVERPKMGFGVPIGEWMRGPLREWAEDLLDPAVLRREGFVDDRMVADTWREHLGGRNREYQLWGVLMFVAWLKAQRELAGARVSETLAAAC